MAGPGIVVLIQAALLTCGALLACVKGLSSTAARRWAWGLWGVSATATLTTIGIDRLASASQTPAMIGLPLATDAWETVICLAVILSIALGLLESADPAQLLLAGGTAGLMSGTIPIWLRALAVVGLLWGKGRDRRIRLLDWRDEGLRLTLFAGVLILAGLLLMDRFAAEARANGWGETVACVCLLAGLGGLTGWFPFPAVRRVAYTISDAPRDPAAPGSMHVSVGGVAARVLLPQLAAASILVRSLAHLQTDAAMAAIVVALVMPSVLAGARLLREDHLADRLALQSSMALGSMLAPLPLLIWQSTSGRTPADLSLWENTNLVNGEALLAVGAAAEVGGWLMAACGVAMLTSANASDQFATAIHGVLRRSPARAMWLAIPLWGLAGLAPAPTFWWRLNLLASLSVAHRRSSLTNLFEPAPAFWVLTAGLLAAWTLAATGWMKLAGRMIWEESLRRQEVVPWRWAKALLWLAALTTMLAGVLAV